MNSENYSLQSSLEKGCQSLNESFTQCVRDLEDKVRSTPLVAVSLAAGLGYVLRFFPITLIIGIVTKLFFLSLKPLILIFGALKLYEFIQKQGGENRSSRETRGIGSPFWTLPRVRPKLETRSAPPNRGDHRICVSLRLATRRCGCESAFN